MHNISFVIRIVRGGASGVSPGWRTKFKNRIPSFLKVIARRNVEVWLDIFGWNLLFVKNVTSGEGWFILSGGVRHIGSREVWHSGSREVWHIGSREVRHIGSREVWHVGEWGVGHVLWMTQIVWDWTCCVGGMGKCDVSSHICEERSVPGRTLRSVCMWDYASGGVVCLDT